MNGHTMKNAVDTEQAFSRAGADGRRSHTAPQSNEPPCIPWWLRKDLESRGTREELKVAYRAILVPLYQELVIDAPDALRRSAGELLCSLTWIELRTQQDLAEMLATSYNAGVGHEEIDAVLDGFLKVAREKMKVLGFVEKLRKSGTTGWMQQTLVSPLRSAARKAREKNADVGKSE